MDGRLALADESELTGPACRELTPPQARALELPLAMETIVDHETSSGIQLRASGLAFSCGQVGDRATCRMRADSVSGVPGHARAIVNGMHRYYLIGSGQAAILDVRNGRARCVLVPPGSREALRR